MLDFTYHQKISTDVAFWLCHGIWTRCIDACSPLYMFMKWNAYKQFFCIFFTIWLLHRRFSSELHFFIFTFKLQPFIPYTHAPTMQKIIHTNIFYLITIILIFPLFSVKIVLILSFYFYFLYFSTWKKTFKIYFITKVFFWIFHRTKYLLRKVASFGFEQQSSTDSMLMLDYADVEGGSGNATLFARVCAICLTLASIGRYGNSLGSHQCWCEKKQFVSE